jgi:hypothetical protein
MPYDNEHAHHKPLSDFINDPLVSETLSNMCRINSSNKKNIQEWKRIESKVTPSQFIPKYVTSTDGSSLGVTLGHTIPTETLYAMAFATVTIDMEKYLDLYKKNPLSSHDISSYFTTKRHSFLFPGSNIVSKGESSPTRSFSKMLFKQLDSCRLHSTSETLLETYESLLLYKKDTLNRKCPHQGCPNPEKRIESRSGHRQCDCKYKRNIYSTDALGLHERMNFFGSNCDPYAQVMQVIERLYLMNFIRSFELAGLLNKIHDFAFIVDGPLAVFQEPGWLSHSIYMELSRINKIVRSISGRDILIFGIEKTGDFVDHLHLLDKNKDGFPGEIPAQTTLLLDDLYIQNNIKSSIDNYGQRNYFGRRFFHKTKSGNLFVVSVPFYSQYEKNTISSKVDQFPRLPDVLSLLEVLKYSRYPNALIPISLAHSAASFPLEMGSKMLRQFFNQNLKNNSSVSNNYA